MYHQAYLRSAQTVLEAYQGQVPFATWLKNFFKEHKKYGSRDRKLIADLCFCYFRLGNAFRTFSVEERLLIAQFLCHGESPFVKEFKPEWNGLTFSSISEKVEYLKPGEEKFIFPLAEEMSPILDQNLFQLSFLQQPDLFLRVRLGNEKSVIANLKKAGVPFEQQGACIRLSNSTKVDHLIEIDREAVVQDISSQKVLEPLQQNFTAAQFSAWDCCAASGGKTILLHDAYPKARLTVSDVRESIILNLRNRLKRAGITSCQSFVADVASPAFMQPRKFDVIIRDAPCSGSGTWGRTPEQLHFFSPEKINYYASLQKKIAANASRFLTSGGYFLYITCSVFSRENEEVVRYLQQSCGLEEVTQQYFKGYNLKGDTLFAALLTAS